MKKITSESFSEDDNLVKFLQNYEPIPPSEVKPCEELIMRSISLTCTQENVAKKKKCDRVAQALPERQGRSFAERPKLLWLLPITIISGLVTLSGQTWRNNQLSPQMVSSYEDIDSFMINTWQGSMLHEPEEEYISIHER